ncbi:hypothetical protein ACPUGQ_10095 [Klebsiella aerogenes]|uniref:hypothetical protein n=1 Tax=Klebsiella aerogenes TaxID=548 RepID=UPI00254F2184|nr:hypothetical protein [Klebsiella aerogenes]MDK6931698.1 hypothetical protein [Klebsiella aerogenes]
MESKGEQLYTPVFETFDEALKSTVDGEIFYIRQQDLKDLVRHKVPDEEGVGR